MENKKGETFNGFNKIFGGGFAHPLQEVMNRNVHVIPIAVYQIRRQSKLIYLRQFDQKARTEIEQKVEFCFADYDKQNDSSFKESGPL